MFVSTVASVQLLLPFVLFLFIPLTVDKYKYLYRTSFGSIHTVRGVYIIHT
jgi:hypothetical protein